MVKLAVGKKPRSSKCERLGSRHGNGKGDAFAQRQTGACAPALLLRLSLKPIMEVEGFLVHELRQMPEAFPVKAHDRDDAGFSR